MALCKLHLAALGAVVTLLPVTGSASNEISLETWVGEWKGTATIWGLPFAPPVLECTVSAEFHWYDAERTAVEGTPAYACHDGRVVRAWHLFRLTPKGISLDVNWGLGNIRFTSEAHAPWLSFFWDRSPLRPFQFLQGLYIQQMTITQFHTPGRLEKTITVKEPGRQPRYLLKGSYVKVR